MRHLPIVLSVAAIGLFTAIACGSSQSQPALAEDPTASASARNTEIEKCHWIPALPEGREDPCNHDNKGASLAITEREDMRAESASSETHTCSCD